MGVITGWLSGGVEWISQFGWFGWWISFLIGTLLSALCLAALAWMWSLWSNTRARRKWSQQTDQINPLDPEFTRRRIKLIDLANPLSRRIVRKKFIDCELMGPANLVVIGASSFNAVAFQNCDIVVLREDGQIANVIGLEQVDVLGGSIWQCTLFIRPALVPAFKEMGGNFITATGDEPPHTPLLPPSAAKGKRRQIPAPKVVNQ